MIKCLPISEDMTLHVSDKNGHKMFIKILQIINEILR
jgi:hypothetical protein